jgi:hypothetical protein
MKQRLSLLPFFGESFTTLRAKRCPIAGGIFWALMAVKQWAEAMPFMAVHLSARAMGLIRLNWRGPKLTRWISAPRVCDRLEKV